MNYLKKYIFKIFSSLKAIVIQSHYTQYQFSVFLIFYPSLKIPYFTWILAVLAI